MTAGRPITPQGLNDVCDRGHQKATDCTGDCLSIHPLNGSQCNWDSAGQCCMCGQYQYRIVCHGDRYLLLLQQPQGIAYYDGKAFGTFYTRRLYRTANAAQTAWNVYKHKQEDTNAK